MAGPDWRAWCRGGRHLQVAGNAVRVNLADGRKQLVRVTESEEAFELVSMVAKAAALDGVEEVTLRAWRRNRASQQVGFRFDTRGHLVAEAWIPVAGITREEFVSSLQHVAAEADLFENQLTGRDRE